MKIAFFTDDYLPYIHGVTSSMLNYKAALEKMGHEVYTIAPKYEDYVDTDKRTIRTPSVNALVVPDRRMSVLYPGLAKKFDKYHFDIVHTHTQVGLGALGYMVAKRQHIPHISTMHTIVAELLDDYPFAVYSGIIAMSIAYPIAFRTKPVISIDNDPASQQLISKKSFKKQAWRLTSTFLNHASACITPSKHLEDTLIKHGLKAPSFVLPNGIDLTKYEDPSAELPLVKNPGEKWILAVARLSGEKRQRILVEAMKDVEDPKVKLLLVGDGPDREDLENLARESGVQDRVVFLGWQSAESVASIMKHSDVFTLASYMFDNQPMVIIEAIASGLPVVICDHNLQEGLTAKNSILTKGIESKDFAEAFNSLLQNEEKLRSMSKHSKLISKEFDINLLAEKLLDIYRSAPPISQPSRFKRFIGAKR